MALPPAPLTSVRGHAKNDSSTVMLVGGGLPSPPLQLTTGLVVNSFIITNSTLAGERMLLIPW